jgi:hypothetical protein
MRIFPNPVHGENATLTLESPHTDHVTVNTYDVSGRLVQSQTIEASKGETKHLMAVPATPGLYFVRAESKNAKLCTVKLTVQ